MSFDTTRTRPKEPTQQQRFLMDKILDIVSECTNILREDIMDETRKQPIIFARTLYVFFCRKLFNVGYDYLTDWHYSTMIHHIRNAEIYFDLTDVLKYAEIELCAIVAKVVEMLRADKEIDFDFNFGQHKALDAFACKKALETPEFVSGYVENNVLERFARAVYKKSYREALRENNHKRGR